MKADRAPIHLFMVSIVLVCNVLAWIPARAGNAGHPVTVYFFWGDGCPNCEVEKPFLDDLRRRYPGIRVQDYEVWYDEDNRQRLLNLAKVYGIQARGVPTTFIGDSVWIGFSDTLKLGMEEKIRSCIENACPDPGARLLAADSAIAGTAEDVAAVAGGPAGRPITGEGEFSQLQQAITIPFLGSIDLSSQSLFFTTSLIAFVDGFNPCSLWVLSLLLAVVIYSGSRKKIFLVGMTFLSITASVYGAFIVGLFSVFAYVSYLIWIQIVVALLALGFGLVNIKDYFWYKRGVSFTISDKYKPKIFKDIRQIMAPDKSLFAMIGATAVMALGITLVELPCTAGFPVIWSKIVAQNNLGGLGFAMLLGLYLVIYLLDELIVFFSVLFTLKASKFEEKHGRVLKLIGGMIMLALAIVLLIDPELMNSVGGSLAVFGAAFLTTLAILIIHRRLLPLFGIRLGSEDVGQKKPGP